MRCSLGAVFDSALEIKKTDGFTPHPEIMIPLVGNENEISILREMVQGIKDNVDPDNQLGDVKIGTMIEIPRVCIVADHIAKYADYFSFGTNDLTQMTLVIVGMMPIIFS